MDECIVMARSFSSTPRSVRHYIFFLAVVCTATVCSIAIYIISERNLLDKVNLTREQYVLKGMSEQSLMLYKLKNAAFGANKDKGAESHTDELNRQDKNASSDQAAIARMEKNQDDSLESLAFESPPPNYNVHIFYYPWYGNPEKDGKYLHWNHQYLPHWHKEEAKRWASGAHKPPDDVGSNFYPQLGPYSSSDPATVNAHMQQIRSSGAGVVVVTWYPPGQADANGQPFDQLMPLILDSADKHSLKVAIHIEPYTNRSGETLSRHVQYIIDRYGKHPGFYKRQVGDRQLPVYYVYDSYQISSNLWSDALKPGARYSLRGTPYDGIFLGLYIGPADEKKLLDSGFDGFYTYFAANGFTKGSTWKYWKGIATFAARNNLLFIPSVGPGYMDTRVRPWNGETTRQRLNGRTFRLALEAALDAGAKVVSVTSFNEWHEGTQIEPAVPRQIDGYKYEDYLPGGPDFYLKLLKEYVPKFSQK